MKNKKIVIVISVLILVVAAIVYGVYNFYSSYMFNEDGTIAGDSKESFITNVKQLEDFEDKKNLVDFAVEHGIISQKEADEILNEK